MLASDVMSQDVVSIDPKKDILDALYTLYKTKADILYVLDGRIPLGVVTMRNLVDVIPNLGKKKPENILVEDVMNRSIKSVRPNDNAKELIDDLCERGAYSIPVMSGKEMVGAVNRLTFVKMFSEKCAKAYRVADLMSNTISTKNIYDSIETIRKEIMDYKTRRIVITDRDEVKGVITLSDLLIVLFSETGNLSDLTIEQVMSPGPLTVERDADVADAAKMMIKWKVGGIIVKDKNQRPEGWIRDRDIVHGVQIRLF